MTQARRRILTQGRRKPGPPPGSGRPAALDKPNVEDPLSEPTRHRRVWAAYLAAGMTRREFAQKLDTNYHTVNRWDAGAAVMSLEMLERAATLLGYSMDELSFGRKGAPAPHIQHTDAPLSEPEIRALMDRMRADPATRAAFGEHAVSPSGRYQSFTGSYVEAWCSAYAATQDSTQALQAATNARAVTEAVSTGVGAVSTEALRAALGRKL